MTTFKKGLAAIILLVFFSAATLLSCGTPGNKGDNATDSTEHPADSTEHPSDSTEHPEGSEHPADSTK
jgi:hypothetical protein